MKNINNFFNVLGVVIVTIVIIFTVVARYGLTELFTISDMLLLISFAIIMFCLPDYFYQLLKHRLKYRWFVLPEFFTFCILLFFAITGLLFENIITTFKFVLLPVSFLLFIWTFNFFYKSKISILLFVGIALPILMLLLFYNRGYESPVFFEKVILGIAHIDVLFFSSISNIFSSVGYSSTGLDGIPYFPYHWGSYALIGGLKSWIGINSLSFINLAYPAIFIVLYLKILISFLYRFFLFKRDKELDILFVFSVLIFFYSLPYTGFNNGNPVSVGNNGLAFIFSFQYLAVLLNYIKGQKEKRHVHFSFLIYSFFSLLFILLFKISVGFTFTLTLLYLCYRYKDYFRSNHIIFIITGAFFLAIFSYTFIFPEARTNIDSTIIERVYFLWVFSDSFITYLLGAFITIVVILKNNQISKLTNFMDLFRFRNYIDYELLLLITILGILGGVFVSTNPSDVFYFATVQFYFSIPYVIYYLHQGYDKLKASIEVRHFFLYIVIFLSLFSRLDLLKYKDGVLEFVEIKIRSQQLSNNQLVLQDLLLDLQLLDKENRKREKCIYIPQEESWFYNSQKNYPKSAPMIVPAISGISMIGGIADSIMNSDYSYYSYYYYKNDYKSVENLDDAIKRAKEKGFKTLIKYQQVDGELDKTIYSLINYN